MRFNTVVSQAMSTKVVILNLSQLLLTLRFVKRSGGSQSLLSVSLEGYDENTIFLNYYLCKDSTCQDKKTSSNIEILSTNYLKIFLTNPFIDGKFTIDEITYSLESEQHYYERFMVPMFQ